MNAYQTLGLAPRLVISEEELRDVFREAGKSAHPDAGGSEGEFSHLREAHGMLASPSRRLRHWLELQGIDAGLRGSIGPSLMDLFSSISTVTLKAEAVIRKRDAAHTALVRALLEGETQLCREEIESAIASIESAIAGECTDFADWESLTDLDISRAFQTCRNLAFLEKWKTGLRSCYSRLV